MTSNFMTEEEKREMKKHKRPAQIFFFIKKKRGPYKDTRNFVCHRSITSFFLFSPLCAYVAVGVIVRRLLLVKGSSAMHATLEKAKGFLQTDHELNQRLPLHPLIPLRLLESFVLFVTFEQTRPFSFFFSSCCGTWLIESMG